MLNRERNEPATLSFELRAVALDPSANSLLLAPFLLARPVFCRETGIGYDVATVINVIDEYHEEEEEEEEEEEDRKPVSSCEITKPFLSTTHAYDTIQGSPRFLDNFAKFRLFSRKILRQSQHAFTTGTGFELITFGWDRYRGTSRKYSWKSYFRSRVFLIVNFQDKQITNGVFCINVSCTCIYIYTHVFFLRESLRVIERGNTFPNVASSSLLGVSDLDALRLSVWYWQLKKTTATRCTVRR